MIKRSLSFFVALVMTVVCLTGCSAGFKTKKALKAAKSYGMTEVTASQLAERWNSGTITSQDETIKKYLKIRNKICYKSKDSNEASDVFNSVYGFQRDSGKFAGLEELFCCEEEYGDVMLLVAVDEKTARMVYDYYLELLEPSNENSSTWVKGGYAYTLLVEPSETPGTADYCGLYVKGKTLLIIESVISPEHDEKFLDYFCKELGVVSPLTLRK